MRKIRIGNQTSCYAPATVPYQFALRHHFDAFEWFSDKRAEYGWSEQQMTHMELAAIRRSAQEAGVALSVHAPCASDPRTSCGAEALQESIRIGFSLGASIVNLHAPVGVGGTSSYVEALRPILKAASHVGVSLSIENTPETSPEDINAIFIALKRVPENVGQVGMCLDIGHANLFDGTKNDYVRFVDLLGTHVPVIHCHAHENWGDRDSHLPLFSGPSARDDSGLRAVTRRLLDRRYAGSVILEQWPDPPEGLLRSRDGLRALLSDETAST